MSSARQTFYEILGVKRSAKPNDIARAYARLRAELQKETTAPDARLAAMAKVAYATLSDPGSRAEYDESLGLAPLRARPTVAHAAAAVAILAAAGAAYYFVTRSAGPAPGAPPFDVPRLLEAVGPRIGVVQAALVSGEVRELGVAIEVGDNEMLTTCRGIEAGTALTVKEGKAALRAEVAHADAQSEMCTLAAKGAREAVKIRSGVPSSQEKLQAVVLTKTGAEARSVNVGRLLTKAAAPAFTLKTATPLPNGTPLFDSREQLVGIVIAPHDLGDGAVVALAASRIEPTRASTANAPAAAAAAGSAPNATAAPPSAGARISGETMVAEGFATLWKEGKTRGLTEVLDDVKSGKVGLPIAYWTRWKGVTDTRSQSNQCVVTFGADEELVAAYDQLPSRSGEEVYRFCALTRFQVDLDDLEVGDYHFIVLVDGAPVAENSIRLERRLVTPTRLMVLVLVLGLALLAWVRKRRVPT